MGVSSYNLTVIEPIVVSIFTMVSVEEDFAAHDNSKIRMAKDESLIVFIIVTRSVND
ncbi:hypothetical protein MASR1M31_19810 [Porphyromonadaceae bacterium]